MISKRIIFLMVFVFCCLFPGVAVGIEIKTEQVLQNNSACWGFVNGHLQYNLEKCPTTKREIDITDLPDYCDLFEGDGFVYQRVMTHSGEWGYIEKTNIYLNSYLSQEYFTCECKIENNFRGCDYKEVDGLVGMSGNLCPSLGIVGYFLVNGETSKPENHNGTYTVDGSEVCLGSKGPTKKCDLRNQTWVETTNSKCGDLQKCVNYKDNGSNSMMKTKCVDDKIRTDSCDTNLKKVRKVNDYSYELVDIKSYMNDQNCINCAIEDGKIKCTHTEDSIIGDCYKVGDVTVDASSFSHKTCYKDQIFICEKNNNDKQYTKGEECFKNTDLKKCLKENGEARCVSENEFNKYDQTSLNITTNSSGGFWCEESKTINTAIGCIPITVSELVENLLPTIFGIAGGIAFLMMVYGFIMVSTSSGDEKKVQEAQKIITSAITGLLVSLFAIFLYRLIAVNILQIPGIN